MGSRGFFRNCFNSRTREGATASVALKKNQLEEEADTKASQKAAEMVAGMGHKAVVDKPEDGEENSSILEQYSALSGEEQRKFYAAHKDELAKLCK